MKLAFFFFFLLVLVGCNDNGNGSPYDELLSKQPYSDITDSIRHEPHRAELYFQRAVVLNENGLPEPALADFRKAWSIEKKEPYAVGVSNILLERKPDSAIVFLKDAVKELPNSLLLPISLVRGYDALGKTDEALAVCDFILKKDADQVNTLLLKADLLEKKGDTINMIQSLEKAYAFIPFNMQLTQRLAYLYAETKNAKALALADTMNTRDSLQQFAHAFYIKGMYYSNTGNDARAIQQFNSTIQRDHRYLNAYIEKGKILFNQNKIAEALKTFQLANRITPSFPDAWFWIGRCLETMGDKAKAKENYEKAYELDNSFIEAKEAAEKLK